MRGQDCRVLVDGENLDGVTGFEVKVEARSSFVTAVIRVIGPELRLDVDEARIEVDTRRARAEVYREIAALLAAETTLGRTHAEEYCRTQASALDPFRLHDLEQRERAAGIVPPCDIATGGSNGPV